MAVVASSRMMVSATVVLTLIVVTGGCLAMVASAVPVANARRLQQQIPRNGVAVSRHLRSILRTSSCKCSA
jgi:hypothetical protein